MKNTKRFLCYILSLLLTLSVITTAIPEKKVDAAATWYSLENYLHFDNGSKTGNFVGELVNGKFIYVTYVNNYFRLMIGSSAKTAKCIKSVPDSRYIMHTNFITDGNKVLFTITDGATNSLLIFKTTINGTAPIKVATIKENIFALRGYSETICSLVGYYNNYLYIGVHNFSGYNYSIYSDNLYKVNIVSKKHSLVKKEYESLAFYNNKLLSMGLTGKIDIFNLSNGNFTNISNNVNNYPNCTISDNKVYFLQTNFEGSQYTLYSSSLSGKTKTKLYTTKTGYFHFVGRKYAILTSASGKYYKFTYATKQLTAYTPAKMPVK